MAYIKNRSNYVIQKKHKLTQDGTIWERDITTVGGLNSFDENQFPIYQSGNFILTVNNEDNISRYVKNQGWEENDKGETWTLNDINNITNSGETDNTMDIVLKPDYYNLKSFAYYGSCVELIRASVGNIVNTFPGELCIATQSYLSGNTTMTTGVNVFYETMEGGKMVTKQLGSEGNIWLIDNPFQLDLHTVNVDKETLKQYPLKYITADNNWTKYDFIVDGKYYEIDNIEVSFSGDTFCMNNEVATITVSYNNSEIGIHAYLSNDGTIIYLSESYDNPWSIRPKTKYLNEFYKSLDSFERILMNKYSEPKYTAIFEVTTENEFTFSTALKTFTFPTTYGGYNLAVNTAAYDNYIKSLVDVADFYDEHFCDNLYRSMTHEAIKNFDFSYSRNYNEGEIEPYIEGGQKIQSALRLIAREFDEIKYYIDNIRNTSVLTYNNINNLPDYFLTDVLDVEGWDIKNIYPFDLNEYIVSGDTKHYRIFTDDVQNDTFGGITNLEIKEEQNLVTSDSGSTILPLYHVFTQNIKNKIKPYTREGLAYPNGYFLMCCQESSGDTKYDIVKASESDGVYKWDECASEARQRIKPYMNEKEYTMNEVNNHFMKILKLNSRSILKHKGTIEGVEMMLSLFGFKSKQYVEGLKNSSQNQNYDYEIVEKTTFMKPIIDTIDNEKGMHKLDWYNSTKAIAYSSNEYLSGQYVPYQGLPVAYWEDGDTRVILPYFNKEAEIDGKPYYQMNGGWLTKNEGYSFDKNNNILSTALTQNKSLYTETLDSIQSVKTLQDLFNIQANKLHNGSLIHVEDLSQDSIVIDGVVYPLLSEYVDNQTYYYISLEVINNSVTVGQTVFKDEIWVSNPFIPLDKWMSGQYISLSKLPSNSKIKIYLIEKKSDYELVSNGEKFWIDSGNTYSATTNYGEWFYEYNETKNTLTTKFTPYEPFITAKKYENTYDTLGLFSGNSQHIYELVDDKYELNIITKPSHYFKLTNVKNKTQLGGDGWNQLSENSYDYYILNSIKDYFKGNNPHRGKLKYDDGYEYISYFTNLFQYALDTNSIDSRCFSSKDDYYYSIDEMKNIGFKLLSNSSVSGISSECKESYPLNNDSKIHYFGNKYSKNLLSENETYIGETYVGGIDPLLADGYGIPTKEIKKDDLKYLKSTSGLTSTNKTYYQEFNVGDATSAYTLSNIDTYKFASGANATTISNENSTKIYGFTEQIVNTKVIEIIFNISTDNKMYTKDKLETTKYLDDVVMPYVTQMIPSNTILQLKYIY